jgi:hypothetical protein
MDQNRLADLREKREQIRARRGDPRPDAKRAGRTSGPIDARSRFLIVAAILMAAMYYLL